MKILAVHDGLDHVEAGQRKNPGKMLQKCYMNRKVGLEIPS